MGLTVWIAARSLHRRPSGLIWAYLNWALGLRSLGCDVVWLELVSPRVSAEKLRSDVHALKRQLDPYSFSGCISLSQVPADWSRSEELGLVAVESAANADLLLNLAYGVPDDILKFFRRTALIDIDPGLLQTWITDSGFNVGRHDAYFTIGETVGRSDSGFPDCGVAWRHTPPCVSLDWWPVTSAPPDAPFTTVSSWSMNEWVEQNGQTYKNDKRAGFWPYIELPRHTSQPLELILYLSEADYDDRLLLRNLGWRVTESREVAATTSNYQTLIQSSRGEFGCAKPSYVRMQTAWISDRTVCYLASGKPAIVQHTGPSRFLPDAEGIFRFKDLAEAKGCFEKVASDYDGQCRAARQLAEEYFDSSKVVGNVLNAALA